MVEIIPSIIAKTYEELETMVQKVEPHVNRVHLDIMDGKFVANQTIAGPLEIKQLIPKLLNKDLQFEVHLMVENPRERFPDWLNTPVSKFVIHLEPNQETFGEIIQIIHGLGKEIMPTINPETQLEILNEHIHNIDGVQLMSVNPGFYGREFIRYTLSRISKMHEIYPGTPIQVDGGMTPDNAKMCIASGASILISGSYIFNSPNIPKAIEELKNV